MLQPIGQRLDVPAPPHRVHRVGNAGLVRQDLLGPERQGRALLRRQREGFVVGVGVQRLGAA